MHNTAVAQKIVGSRQGDELFSFEKRAGKWELKPVTAVPSGRNSHRQDCRALGQQWLVVLFPWYTEARWVDGWQARYMAG